MGNPTGMKPRAGRRTSLELLDEAFHVLRNASAETWLIYLLGSISFLLLLVFEWHSLPGLSALSNLPEHSAVLALAYLLFGISRNLFARKLKQHVWQDSRLPLSMRNLSNDLLLHTAELVFLPCAALSIVALPWMLSFFRFVKLEQETRFTVLIRNASRRASSAQRESWIFTAVVASIVLIMFLNIMAALLIFPDLLTAISGYETPLTRSRGWAINATTAIAALGVSLLLGEALLLAAFTLVMFYQDAHTSARDLLQALKNTREGTKREPASAATPETRLAQRAGSVVLLLSLSMTGIWSRSLEAATSQQAISARDLDREINKVLREGEYNWASGANVGDSHARPKSGPLAAAVRVVTWVGEGIRGAFRAIAEWLDHLLKRQPPPKEPEAKPASRHIAVWWVAGLAILAAGCGLGIVFHTHRTGGAAKAQSQDAQQCTVDLGDELVLATALPEDEWLALANEYMEKGEKRLAVRALYLSGMAALAKQELLTITPYKTTADYRMELRRRSRSQQVTEAFARSGTCYERVWYGLHELSPESIREYEHDVAKLRGHVHA